MNSRNKAINMLRRLAIYWPKDIELFGASGSLLIIESDTHKELAQIDIYCDGGDPDYFYDDNKNRYINKPPADDRSEG